MALCLKAAVRMTNKSITQMTYDTNFEKRAPNDPLTTLNIIR